MARSGFVASYSGLVVVVCVMVVYLTTTAVGQEMSGPESPDTDDRGMPRDDAADPTLQEAYNDMGATDEGGDAIPDASVPADAEPVEDTDSFTGSPDDAQGEGAVDSYTPDDTQGGESAESYANMPAEAQAGETPDTYPAMDTGAPGDETTDTSGTTAVPCEKECSKTDNNPVCGSDGTTYPNHCEFNNKKCKVKLLEILKEGECLPQDRCLKSCPGPTRPVCASDGRTYANLCELRKEMCDTTDLTSEHGGYC